MRQWIEACNHLSKGMREHSLWKEAIFDEEREMNLFEQVQDWPSDLFGAPRLTQSIRGMQANAQQKDCMWQDMLCTLALEHARDHCDPVQSYKLGKVAVRVTPQFS